MTAAVLPMYEPVEQHQAANSRQDYFDQLGKIFDDLERMDSLDTLGAITRAIFQRKSQILGQMAPALPHSKFSHLLDQQLHTCPHCKRVLSQRALHKRRIETLLGDIDVERPYFYRTRRRQGFYPFDAALQLGSTRKQYDIQDLEAWLALFYYSRGRATRGV